MSGSLLVLVGPMRVGKSTVGQLLAEHLSVGYRNTDDDIAAEQERTIRFVQWHGSRSSSTRRRPRKRKGSPPAPHGVASLLSGGVADQAAVSRRR